MKFRLAAAASVAASLALAAIWFFAHYEQLQKQVWVGPSGAARNNPYLAAMRFSERFGIGAALFEQAARLHAVAPDHTVVLPSGRDWLGERRAHSLLRSVEHGGHLLVEPEPADTPDPLLDALAVGRQAAARAAATFEMYLPGSDEPLQVGNPSGSVLELSRVQPDIVAADERGVRLLSMPHGAGRVTVITGLQRFDNRHIGQHDNAELLRRVLVLTPSEKMLIVRPAPRLPLWDWLAERAAAVLSAGTILIALALWRVLPRFGPVAPEAAPERRELLEHLRASGRFRWSHGERSSLLISAREQLERQIGRASPRLLHLPRERLYAELATRFDIDAHAVRRAFEDSPRGARDLVQGSATLASIHAGLSGTRRHPLARRKRT